MDLDAEVFLTSRSRAPSIIDVTTQNDHVFAQLPDIIQEAAISTEFSSPNLVINRVHESHNVESKFMTKPQFFITRRDSGISMPDLDIKDPKFLAKYGSDLSANFADIKTSGPNAFLRKENKSNGAIYSLCTCATGYIWVSVRYLREAANINEYSDLEIQIGTFALKARAITTVEILTQYLPHRTLSPLNGSLALLCSTVLGKYLQSRMLGHQYEFATENAIRTSRYELAYMSIVDPVRFGGDLDLLLKEVCNNAPMPPTSVVSLISRSMVMNRWKDWKEKEILRKRYTLPGKLARRTQYV
ncbi:hypothetical protein GLAREA_02653 [Glarea lozoyensis ATCC 20868]|uniref:Uncharacterized protein n=1 Tax=Glarea lozoyensis (strain ATCC 20868 / MF5171) TaxID=1116229 RepID=S3CNI9_GLAL2|nr:uncharacterized protein GLAREA_02653 [Glarea lozoyensis ATCC 20868]EPE26739.1 hypothetical protein GLAREA_02653 [Glarea lozoyensis ATCC 20868]